MYHFTYLFVLFSLCFFFCFLLYSVISISYFSKSFTRLIYFPQCENAGRWQEALDAYDEAMRMPAPPRAHRVGHVRCLRALGKLETLQTVVKGSPSSAQPALLPYAVQATWRLGEWDHLGSLINGMCR